MSSSKSLSRSVVLEILGRNKNAKDAIDEVKKSGDELGKKKYTVTLDANTKEAVSKLDKANLDVDKFGKKDVSATAGVDTRKGEINLSGLANSMNVFGKRKDTATADVDTDKGDAKLKKLDTEVDDFGKKKAEATADVDTQHGTTVFGKLRNALEVFSKRNYTSDADVSTKKGTSALDELGRQLEEFAHSISTGTAKLDDDDAKRKLIDMNLQLKKFADETYTAKTDVNDEKSKMKLVNMQLELDKIGRAVERPDIDDKGMLKASLEMDKLKLKMDALNHDDVDVHVKVKTDGRSPLLEIMGGIGGGGAGGGIRQMMNQLSYAGSEGGDSFAHGFIKATTFGVKGAIVTLGGMLLSILPAVGALAGGFMGVALIGGMAAMLLAKNQKVKSAAGQMGTQVMGALEKAIAPLVPYVVNIIHQVVPLIKSIAPVLTGIFKEIGPQLQGIFNNVKVVVVDLVKVMKAAAPAFGPLINALLDLVKAILPPLAEGIHALIPSIKMFGSILSTLGKDLGSVFSAAAPVIKASMSVLGSLLKIIGSLLPIIMKLAGIFAQSLAPVLAEQNRLWKELAPAITLFGKILGSLAAAVLGAFMSLLKAMAQLLVAIEPSIKILISSFALMFKTLESSGVVFILENALEGLVGPIARLINLLVKDLAPIMPIVIRLFADLLGILAKVGGAVLGAIAKGLADVIQAVPPSVIRGLAYAFLAWYSALKLCHAGMSLLRGGLTVLTNLPMVGHIISQLAIKMGLLTASTDAQTAAQDEYGASTQMTTLKTIAQTLWTGICKVATLAWAAACWVANAAMDALNAAMDADPIILAIEAIIAAIILIGVAIYEIIKHWRGFASFFVGLWHLMRAAAIVAWHLIYEAAKVVWGWMKEAWPPLLHILEDIWGGMKRVAVDVWHGIVAGWNWLYSVLKTGINELKGFFAAVWEGIKSVGVAVWHGILAAWNWLFGALKSGGGAVKSFFVGMWDVIKSLGVSAWHGIEAAWNWLWGILKSTGGAMKNFFVSAWNAIKTIGDAVWHGIGAAWNWLYSVLKSGFSGAKNFFVTVWDGMKTIAVDVWHAIEAAWSWLYGILKSGVNGFKNFFVTVWNDIKNIAVDVWHAIVAVWDWLAGVLKGGVESWKSFWISTWNDLKNDVVDVWHAIYAAWSWLFGVLKSGANAFRAFFIAAWNDIKNWAVDVWHAIVSAWNWAVGVIKAAITDLKDFFVSIWNYLKNFITDVWHGIVDGWNWAVGVVKDGITDVKNFFVDAWNHIKSFFDSIVGGISSGWDHLISGIKNGITGAWQWIVQKLGDIKNAFLHAINFVCQDILNPLFRVWDSIAGAVGLKSLEIKQIKNFADGGTVQGNGITDNQLAVLKPGEYVMNRRQVANAGGAPNIEKSFGYSSGGGTTGRFAMTDGGPSPGNSKNNPADTNEGKAGAKFGQGRGRTEGDYASLGSTILDVGKDVLSGATKIADWVAKEALDPLIRASLGPILSAMTSGLGHFGSLGKILETFVNTVVTHLMADASSAASSGGGGTGPAGLVNFAKTFVGKVPYHLGGGADYAPYGEIKTPADANRLGGWDCAGFVGQMYGHFGIGPGPSGINVSKLEGWGKKTKAPVVGGFATEAGDQTVADPGHVVLIATPTTSIQAAHTGTDTIMIGDKSSWVQTYVPPKGFSGAGMANVKAGDATQNGKDIYSFLLANLFAGHKIAAAGALASMYGESGWNPESKSCVPLTYKVVTTRGILKHDEVRKGDHTIVLDPISGEVVGAEILDVPYHAQARMCRIGNDHWSVICTTDHKWITDEGKLVRADNMPIQETRIWLGNGWFESVDYYERLDKQDTFCLTTSTGTWTAYRDNDVAESEGVKPGPFWTGNTGGWGLMGWTDGLWGQKGNFTGNASRDMGAQLQEILTYVAARSDGSSAVAEMEKSTSVVDAANIWGKAIEAYGVTDVHAAGIALATQIMNSTSGGYTGATKTYSSKQITAEINKLEHEGMFGGGIIREPIFGVGLSGKTYSFGELGNEAVIPLSGGSNYGGDTYNVMVAGDSDPDGAALRIIQAVRNYKRHHGNQPTGIG